MDLQERYLIALGSNVRHHHWGGPARVIAAALKTLAEEGVATERFSPIHITPPIGPSRRRFANAAAVVRTHDRPDAFLVRLKQIERHFGRRSGGARWRERVIDLDIVLWNGGACVSEGLIVPHPSFRERDFVLRPAAAIAPGWRDPKTGLTIRQLAARLTRPCPVRR